MKGQPGHKETEFSNVTEGIGVWDLSSGKMVSRFPAKYGAIGFVTIFGFLSPDQLLMRWGAGESHLIIGDVKTGQMRNIDLPRQIQIDSNRRTLSPTGKYLASIESDWLNVIDLAAGEVAGHLKVPGPDGNATGKVGSIIFSPTGSEIAIVGEVGEKHWLCFVDVATGQITANFLGDPYEIVTDGMGPHHVGVDLNGHNPTEYLPGGRAIRFNREILDLKTGHLLARFNKNSADPLNKLDYARILSDETVLVFDETFGKAGVVATQRLGVK